MYVYMGQSISATIEPKYSFVIHITLIKGIEKYFDLFIKIRQGHVRSRSTRRVTSENTFCNFRSILHHASHALRLMLININGQIISN